MIGRRPSSSGIREDAARWYGDVIVEVVEGEINGLAEVAAASVHLLLKAGGGPAGRGRDSGASSPQPTYLP